MAEAQFLFAKNSELIFTVDGRHLCSAVNPTKEAQAWVAAHQERWSSCEAAIVLGLGCGYHVRALQASTTMEVIAVEPDRSTIAAALRVHPLDLKESEIVHFEREEDLACNEALTRVTRKSYAVLLHEPSVFRHRSMMLEARRFLLGRNEAGLAWLFRNRNMATGAPDSPLLNALRELLV